VELTIDTRRRCVKLAGKTSLAGDRRNRRRGRNIAFIARSEKRGRERERERERERKRMENNGQKARRCNLRCGAAENVEFRARGGRAIAMRRRTPVQSVIIITLPPARSVYEHIYAPERNAGSGGIWKRRRRPIRTQRGASSGSGMARWGKRSCSPRQMFTPWHRGDALRILIAHARRAHERQWAAGNWRNWM